MGIKGFGEVSEVNEDLGLKISSKLNSPGNRAIGIKNANIEDTSRKGRTNIERTQPLNMCYPVPGPFQTPFPIAGTDTTGEPDYNEGLFTRFEEGGGLGDGSAPSLSGHTSELANCSKQC
ncbi:hypothetical protein CDAR_478161 [Caerostris darwini]|uniref:Uncharacterized protein n=1 Tax=Caerostris darwini TaxID=1538125 RepID=A0AAV4UKE3_9ARAC|nr:hypothetical protein CDAR_478161 [Caerostris darwini]